MRFLHLNDSAPSPPLSAVLAGILVAGSCGMALGPAGRCNVSKSTTRYTH